MMPAGNIHFLYNDELTEKIKRIEFFEQYFGVWIMGPENYYIMDYFDYEFNELILYDNPDYRINAFNYDLISIN